jgi:hypothetical protein
VARITERDRVLLAFTAAHRLVLAAQLEALLGCSGAAVSARLKTLVRAGLLSRRTLFDRQPSCYQITRDGLAVIGGRLSPPRLDLRAYDHDVGLGWIWLAARRGSFGALADVVSERQLRSGDARRESEQAPLGVRLGGVGPSGRERLHYPDLLLHTASGQRVAVELELSSKGRTRREKILAGYAGDPRIDAVLYLVERPSLGREIASSASRLGISRLVHVQLVSRPERGGRASVARVAQRTAAIGTDRQAACAVR